MSNKCDICGSEEDAVWFAGVCRCRNYQACAIRAPQTWQRVIDERRERWQNTTLAGAIYRMLSELLKNER